MSYRGSETASARGGACGAKKLVEGDGAGTNYI